MGEPGTTEEFIIVEDLVPIEESITIRELITVEEPMTVEESVTVEEPISLTAENFVYAQPSLEPRAKSYSHVIPEDGSEPVCLISIAIITSRLMLTNT